MKTGRKESDLNHEERLNYFMYSGAFYPEGWAMPRLCAPSECSDGTAHNRALAQVEALKSAIFFSGQPIERRPWAELPEWSKFQSLRHWIDWDGVSAGDRAAVTNANVSAQELATLLIEEREWSRAVDIPELMELAERVQQIDRGGRGGR